VTGYKHGLREKKKIVQSCAIKGSIHVVNASGGAIGRIVSFFTKTSVVLASQMVLPASLQMEYSNSKREPFSSQIVVLMDKRSS
jgi:hypothetical protein